MPVFTRPNTPTPRDDLRLVPRDREDVPALFLELPYQGVNVADDDILIDYDYFSRMLIGS